MNDPKVPVDARIDQRFYGSALLKAGEHSNGTREYIVRGSPEGPPLIQCHGALQLGAVVRGLNLPFSRTGQNVLSMCTELVGEVMSQRVHGEDFHDSGRGYQGYELAWLPGGGTYTKIVKALEKAGEHGLAALMREGRVGP